MKTLPSALADRLESGVTALATCWIITRADATVQRYTDAETDLILGGQTYLATPSLSRTAVAVSLGLSPGNLEVNGALDAVNVSEQDLMAGRYDGARVEVFMVDTLDPDDGAIPIVVGFLGEVETNRNGFRAELQSLAAVLSQSEGEVTTPECRVRLGSARCKVNLASFTVTGTVASVTSNALFATSVTAFATDWFRFGVLTWTGGNNAGSRMEIAGYTTGTGDVRLALPMTRTVQVGDTFSMHAGCDKTLATCAGKFANVVNFQGEPHVPGLDRALNP